nr:zinc finger, CCHC-type [Tanacetum cinerariifolium]
LFLRWSFLSFYSRVSNLWDDCFRPVGEKDWRIFNHLWKSKKIPSVNCLSSFKVSSFSRPTSSFLALLDHKLPGFQEVFNLLEEGSILSLEVSLSGECDVEKNGKWSCIYTVGSHEYQAVCTRPDIESVNVAMYMTLMKAKKEAVWLKRLSTDSGAKLKCVAVGATGSLTKADPGSRF